MNKNKLIPFRWQKCLIIVEQYNTNTSSVMRLYYHCGTAYTRLLTFAILLPSDLEKLSHVKRINLGWTMWQYRVQGVFGHGPMPRD